MPPRPHLDLAERLRRLQRPNLRIDWSYGAWLQREAPPRLASTGPLISVVMPVFDPPPRFLHAAIASVRAQTYRDWELCIADDASTAPDIAAVLDGHQAADERIGVVRLPRNAGIVAASNAALALARGSHVALLDHDDVLAPHALARVAAELAAWPDADLLFSDEDKLVGGRRCHPYFKPGWDPVLLLGQNLVSHLGVYRRALVAALGGFRDGSDGSQDYDLALRVAAASQPARIRHIPEVLYHWRQRPDSFSSSHAERAAGAARRAVASHLGDRATVQPDATLPHWQRIRYRLPEPPPLVCLVLPSGDAPADPDYPRVERVAPDRVRTAAGEIIVFLAPGLLAPEPGWLGELVGQAMQPGTGAAGPRLDWPDGRLADAGHALDRWRIVRTLRPRSDRDDPGYVGQLRLPRCVSALSPDAFVLRRAVFERLGGLYAAFGAYAHVDLCLRLAASGLRCVWTPHARLRYATRPRPTVDRLAARRMRARWGDTLARDPHLNDNLIARGGNLSLRPRPPRTPA